MAESQPKEYTALSYTWGDSVFDASIIIDGQRASITTSLKNALVELSKIENLTQGKWWIDQVCINQSDVEERNAQVGLMREIYKLSRGVTIWLGEPVDPSYNAIDVIKGAILHNDRQPGRRERQHKKSTIEVVQKNWEELRRFFQMPWWSRCWVRQEVG
ncbi:hypothetical protein P152DRAFT_391823 [Eremomyces bilateralis CBS 781.70]|uniref:Heterokaryon incompatibility domain-containing protein n=1 Tax=Eremomyces bilateralis CBS 781.70 TaxID=1392243 RepID=A0A6G1G9Q2_9PEZI|nr:uncharacterized protein P152DRAFT_391823 [Eremomyces bilateralis CBS 781.70]KAF1814808.1 hypothetical protein P152DRAFT_391823 [Eremomyces bilateralis CBS 781.70]